jgi:hypothetical protein
LILQVPAGLLTAAALCGHELAQGAVVSVDVEPPEHGSPALRELVQDA